MFISAADGLAGDVTVFSMQFDTCGARRLASAASSGYGASSEIAMYDRSRRYQRVGEAVAERITRSSSR
jgi:hypothetical protein